MSDVDTTGLWLCGACGRGFPSIDGREPRACPHCGDDPYTVTVERVTFKAKEPPPSTVDAASAWKRGVEGS